MLHSLLARFSQRDTLPTFVGNMRVMLPISDVSAFSNCSHAKIFLQAPKISLKMRFLNSCSKRFHTVVMFK